MRAAATVVLALSALVCVNAFASSFYTAKLYATSTTCSGTVTSSTNVPVPIDECVVSSGSGYVAVKAGVSGGALSLTKYVSGKDCTGATVGGNVTSYTTGQCVVTGGSSILYTFPIDAAPMWSLTTYSGSSCDASTISSGPTYAFGLDAACTGGVAITMVNGPLQACTTSCNADCVNIPTGECQSPSGSGGVIYYSNGVGAQAVVTYATAALIAVAAVVLSL